MIAEEEVGRTGDGGADTWRLRASVEEEGPPVVGNSGGTMERSGGGVV
jgi:hypothetical protein